MYTEYALEAYFVTIILEAYRVVCVRLWFQLHILQLTPADKMGIWILWCF
jgi:hypothetical protein